MHSPFFSFSASRALGNNFKRVIGFMCGLIRDVVRALCINRAPPQLKASARAGRWIHGGRYEQLQRGRYRRSVYYRQYGKFQRLSPPRKQSLVSSHPGSHPRIYGGAGGPVEGVIQMTASQFPAFVLSIRNPSGGSHLCLPSEKTTLTPDSSTAISCTYGQDAQKMESLFLVVNREQYSHFYES
ncbi:uncharacterized protein LOC125945209 [Dermacentor silvarum]|uniref:uncharacterized protein LOC125945209 n=1 Tax=Dermacentor silvarum TaxID=543639 RepID=UPI002100E629|nr:uncharacterized protein LOC125945209 [Dermacentor silvarum]